MVLDSAILSALLAGGLVGAILAFAGNLLGFWAKGKDRELKQIEDGIKLLADDNLRLRDDAKDSRTRIQQLEEERTSLSRRIVIFEDRITQMERLTVSQGDEIIHLREDREAYIVKILRQDNEIADLRIEVTRLEKAAQIQAPVSEIAS